MKYLSKLTDAELTAIYKSFMISTDKFVDLTITRDENSITLEGHICIPEEDEEYADEDGYCLIDEDYEITDYDAKAYHHSGNMSYKLREYLYEKFGVEYAKDYLFMNNIFTGHYDRNGKPIFLGDKIKEGCNGLISTVEFNKERGAYWLKDLGDGYSIEDSDVEWTKIKKRIYEN